MRRRTELVVPFRCRGSSSGTRDLNLGLGECDGSASAERAERYFEFEPVSPSNTPPSTATTAVIVIRTSPINRDGHDLRLYRCGATTPHRISSMTRSRSDRWPMASP